MLRISELSDEELRELISRPMTDEEAQTLIRINKSDRWLLALNLREMERQESDPNYDPANDPTCVRVEFENDEE